MNSKLFWKLLEIEADAFRRNRLLWVPVFFGLGIGVYFSLNFEPTAISACLIALILTGIFWIMGQSWLRELVLAVLVGVCGFTLATYRTEAVRAPVLDRPQVMNIEGRIVHVDRSRNGRLRLTLANLHIAEMAPEALPARVRVAASDEAGRYHPGMRVMVKARLAPPGGPVEPGGFDYRRMAWFQQLGGIGYALGPVVMSPIGAEHGIMDRIRALRMAISVAIQDRIGGRAGGFAAAIFTGDRSGVDEASLEDLRASNLAHLLAISGLHMGLLTGFVFGMIRAGLATVPAVALRLPAKKFAAAAAILAGAAYLVLSGASVATQRAFVMVAVMFLAVLLDRPAITIRAVAIAAMIVLILRPVSLVEAGFQMSFAATTALVVGFDLLRRQALFAHPASGWAARIGRGVFALAFSSFLAGLATAPISAFHFNQIAQYGLLANLLSVPVMGFVVMPAGAIAAMVSPLGLEAGFLAISGIGIDWILGVAGFVAALDGARILVPATHDLALLLVVAGGLIIALLASRMRWAGAVFCLAAVPVWQSAPRPDVLIAQEAKIWGVMGNEGRVLSRGRGQGFAAESWLENDGDGAAQALAAGRGLGGAKLHVVVLRKAGDADGLRCDGGTVVVNYAGELDGLAGCVVIAAHSLDRPGSIAVFAQDDAVRFVTAAEAAGRRPWSEGQ